MNMFLLITLFALIVLCAVISWLIGKKSANSANAFTKIASACIFVYCVVLAFVINNELQPLSLVGMYVWSALLVVIIAVACIVFGKKVATFDARTLSYSAICLATSFALSYVGVHVGAGSVTLASLLPLALFSYMFGIKRGVIVGIVYGFLQFIQSPYVYHYMQVLLDYPLAFSTVGLAGIIKERNLLTNKPTAQFLLGATLCAVLRYFSHVISGYYFWGSYAQQGYTAFTWSAITNAFVFVDFAVVCVVACILFSAKSFCRLVLSQD